MYSILFRHVSTQVVLAGAFAFYQKVTHCGLQKAFLCCPPFPEWLFSWSQLNVADFFLHVSNYVHLSFLFVRVLTFIVLFVLVPLVVEQVDMKAHSEHLPSLNEPNTPRGSVILKQNRGGKVLQL